MRFGRFEVQKVLGRGGMGTVYLAVDPLIGRTVAIKEIRVDPSDDERERKELEARFKLEFRAAGTLSHPNIVTIYDVGQGGNSYFIAMEFVAGMSLADHLRKVPDVAPGQLCSIATQIASGLDYAHKREIVHRDIKPANVLMTQDGRPKITDFGLVKMLTSELTMTGTVLGTPAFMSPEQVMGDDVDGKSDQFSFAVILYLMLTGNQPFAAEHPSAILYKIVHEAPPPPRTLNSKLPSAIDRVVLRGLSKKPDDRYPTCTALAKALTAALNPSTTTKRAEATPHPKPLEQTANDEGRGDDGETSKLEAETAPLTPANVQLDGSQTPTPRSRHRRAPSILKPVAAVAFIVGMAVLGYVASIRQRDDHLASSTPPSGVAPSSGPIEHSLRVEAGSPGAAILINGEPSGRNVPADIDLGGHPGEIFLLELTVDSKTVARRTIVLGPEAPEAWLPSLPSAEPMTLQVTSQPAGATIVIDGRETDLVTPTQHQFAPDRRHSLTFRLQGYDPLRWSFELDDLSDKQRECSCIHFPLSSSVPPGFVTVDAPYQITILVDGRRHGPFPANTPVEVPMPPGRHQVTLVAEDVFLSQTSSVEIDSGQRWPIRLPRLVAIRVIANPANCRVSIDGKDVDDTPINNLLIAAGPHDFSFHWPILGKTKHIKKVVSRSRKRISASPD